MYKKSLKNFRKSIVLLIPILLVLISFCSIVFAEDVTMRVNKDKYYVVVDHNITISGAAFNTSGVKPDVNFTMWFSDGREFNSTADSTGEFERSIKFNETGTYTVNVTYSDTTSSNIVFEVTNMSDAKGGLGVDTYNINISDFDVSNWDTATPPTFNATSLYNGTMDLNGTNFQILVENASNYKGNYSCSRIFVDNDQNFNFTDSNEDNDTFQEAKYLEENSEFTVNGTDYKVTYIDPMCSQITIIESTSHEFSGGEARQVTAKPLDENNTPLNLSKVGGNMTFEIYNQEGSLVSNETVNETEWNFTVPNSSGQYTIYADKQLIDTFRVEKFDMIAKILGENGEEISVVASQATLNITVSLLDQSTASSISSATVMAQKEGVNYTLSYDSTNAYYYREITAPTNGTVKYNVLAIYSGDSQKTSVSFEVKAFKPTTTEFSDKKGEGDGFAPNSTAVVIVSSRNMTDGSSINLSTDTSNCDPAYINLTGVYDINNNNQLINYTSMNLTEFFDAKANVGETVPAFVQEDMKRKYGETACIVNFSTPDDQGTYTTIVNVTINNDSELAYSSVELSEIFVTAHPMSSFDAYQWYVSPGDRVYLGIDAFDGVTGEEIDRTNISSASIVEVEAEDGTIVTGNMLNETFSNSTSISGGGGTYAALSFVVNDSHMGHHRVKFKVNVTFDRSGELKWVETTGTGWFMEKKYHVFAYPQSSGGRWFFGSSDAINLTVEVYDDTAFASFGTTRSSSDTTSGSSSLENIVATVDEVRDMFTWKKVGFQVSPATTNSFGRATLTLNYSNSSTRWDTGEYNVRIKIKSSDGTITDYGYAWFEIKNFMFYAWSDSWQVKTGQDIPIVAFVEYFNSSPIIGTNMTIDKIIYHGSWPIWTNTEVDPSLFKNSAGINNLTTPGIKSLVLTVPGDAITKTGEYEIILKATTPDGASQTTRTWVQSKAFVIHTTDPTKRDSWNPTYAPSSVMVINITAGTSYDWSKWPIPINGTHNITDVWASSVEKEGMMGPFMRKETGSSKNIVQNWTCNITRTTSTGDSNNTCNLTISTNNFDVGSYHMTIVANDSNGAEATQWYMFTIKTFGITTPELKRVRVDTAYPYRNKTSIITNSSWTSCSSTQVTAPNTNENASNNVSECRAMKAYYISEDPGAKEIPSILIDLNSTDTSVRKIYLNLSTDSQGGGGGTDFRNLNFSNSTNGEVIGNISGYGVGDTFSWDGVTYIIKSITTTVELEATNAMGYDSTGNGKWDYDESAAGCQGALCKINISDATAVYYLSHTNSPSWEALSDDEWQGMDLNGDGDYQDSYYIAVQEKVGGGINKVYTSNSSDFTGFTTGKPLHTYPDNTSATNFSRLGNQSYYVGASYIQSGGSGGTDTGNTYIEVSFTTTREGWGGYYIGTFKQGVNVSIPVLIKDANGVALVGANVSVREATVVEGGPPTTSILANGTTGDQNQTFGNATTDSNGIAVIRLNTSWFSNPFGASTGTYAIKVHVVSNSLTGSSTGMPWEWTKIKIANFDLRVEPGVFGSVSGLKQITTGDGETLKKINMFEAATGRTLSLERAWCGSGDSDLYRPYDWMYRNLIINQTASNTTVYIDSDSDCDLTGEDSYANGSIIKMQKSDHTQFLGVNDMLVSGGSLYTLSCTTCGTSDTSEASRTATIGGNTYYLESIQGNTTTIKRTETEWNWDWTQGFSNDSYGFYTWPGGDEILVNNVTCEDDCDSGTVTFTWQQNTLILGTPSSWGLSLGGSWKVVKIANSTATSPVDGVAGVDQYELVIFDNSTIINGENYQASMWGWDNTYADTIVLIDGDDGDFNKTYYFGDYISEIGLTVFGARMWEEYAYATNYTNVPYPLPWFCDDTDDFWFGNFTEAEIGKDLDSEMYYNPMMGADRGESGASENETYYIIVYDSMCDGTESPSGGMYDDDLDMLDISTWMGNSQTNFDLYGLSAKANVSGHPNETGDTFTSGNQQTSTFSEKWFQIGQENWPVSFSSINTTNATNGTLITQNMKEMFDVGEVVSFTIRASNLDGTSFSGTASVVQVMDMREFTPITPPTDTATITNGLGVLKLTNFSTSSGTEGGYMFTIKVCDSSVCETSTRSAYIGTMNMMMGCGPAPMDGGGGGTY